jgi:hypothetical protein
MSTRKIHNKLSLLFLIFIFALNQNSHAQQSNPSEAPSLHWYKGNTHTHTLNSDGDSTPDEVVRWYRESGYHFLVLTDHNYLTNVNGLNALYGADNKFLVIKGEEITDKFGDKPIHVNGLDIEHVIEPQGGSSVTETLQRNVNVIRKESGVPHINHPNYHWAITTDDLLQINNYKLFEIFNGHPFVNNLGGGDRPGLEEMWDILLSNGKLVYGIAVDDAHYFKRPWDKNAALPGQGWVMVRAESLTVTNILQALEKAEFYASTGVVLTDYMVKENVITITIHEANLRHQIRYRTEFIGEGGKLLKETDKNPAIYNIKGNEKYVRVKISDSNGKVAWTQPVMIK